MCNMKSSVANLEARRELLALTLGQHTIAGLQQISKCADLTFDRAL